MGKRKNNDKAHSVWGPPINISYFYWRSHLAQSRSTLIKKYVSKVEEDLEWDGKPKIHQKDPASNVLGKVLMIFKKRPLLTKYDSSVTSVPNSTFLWDATTSWIRDDGEGEGRSNSSHDAFVISSSEASLPNFQSPSFPLAVNRCYRDAVREKKRKSTMSTRYGALTLVPRWHVVKFNDNVIKSFRIAILRLFNDTHAV